MKAYLLQLKSLWQQLGLNQRVSMALALVAVVGGMLGLVVWAHRPQMQLLYGRLAEKDVSEVVSAVQAAGIKYEMGGGGSSIYVPSSEVHKLRLQLAGKGIPSGEGIGFEVFDRPNFGISDFIQRTNYIRALQGELARTISQLQGVRSARVLIVQPENRLLFTDTKAKPTASVFVEGVIGTEAVNSVRFLVANAVEGLKADDVAVIDHRGNVLTENLRDDPQFGAASSQMKLRKSIEDYMGHKVETMLSTVLGPGNTVVRVSADLETDTSTRSEERYDPDGQVMRTEMTVDDNTITSEREPNAAGVGAPANVPNNNGAEASGGAGKTTGKNSEAVRKNKTTSYEINRVTLNATRGPGSIARLTAAVFVSARAQPRTPAEIDSLRRMVANALGIKAADDKEVARFVTLEESTFEPVVEKKTSVAELALGHIDFFKSALAVLAAGGLVLFFVKLLRQIKPDNIPIELLQQEQQLAVQAASASPEITPAMLNDMIQLKPENVGAALRGWMASAKN